MVRKVKSFPCPYFFYRRIRFGVGALGIVWMRMEISKVAKHCRDLEDRREIVSREVQDLREKIRVRSGPQLWQPWFREIVHAYGSSNHSCVAVGYFKKAWSPKGNVSITACALKGVCRNSVE